MADFVTSCRRHKAWIHYPQGPLRPSTHENIVLKYQFILTRTAGEEAFWKCGRTDRQTDTSTDSKCRYKSR